MPDASGLRWWEITDHQWVYVFAVTLYCSVGGQSPWGLLTLPLWYGVALLGKSI